MQEPLQVEAPNYDLPRDASRMTSSMGPPHSRRKPMLLRAIGILLLFISVLCIVITFKKGGWSYFLSGFECTAEQTGTGCTGCYDEDECFECIPGRQPDPASDGRAMCTFHCTADQQSPDNHCSRCEDAGRCSACVDGYKLSPAARCHYQCSVPGTKPPVVIQDTEYAAGACIDCLPGEKCARCRDGYDLNDGDKCVVAPGPELLEFYMYRATSAESYPLDGTNLASAAGVMSYLHVEVVSSENVGTAKPAGGCLRKYDISKVQRWHIRMKNTPMVYNFDNGNRRGQFAQFKQFDSAKCTFGAPSFEECNQFWRDYGYAVGCQPRSEEIFKYPEAYWYSLPGTCPQQDFTNKTADDCKKKAPGGSCSNPDGTPFCTYEATLAGEVSLDQLVGICSSKDCTGFKAFCEEGKKEFKCPPQPGRKECNDNGLAVDFWKGYNDIKRNAERADKLKKLFRENYPNLPELETPACDGW